MSIPGGKGKQIRSWLKMAGPLVVLAIFPFIFKSAYPLYLVNIVGIAVVFALSLNLLFGYAGQISIGHGGFYAVGAYGVALLGGHFTFLPSLVLSTILGGVIALGLGLPILRLRGHYLAMGTLAFGIIVHFTAIQWVDLTGGPWGVSASNPTFFGVLLKRHFYFVIVAVAVGTFLLCRNLGASRVGRAMRTIREDETVAQSLGINVTMYKGMVFSLSGALAALAGGLYAGLNLYVTPSLFDLNLSILVVVMVVLGGAGTTIGPVIGAGLVTLLPELLHSLQDYQLIVFGMALLFVLLFMPQGIAGFARERMFSRKGNKSGIPEGRGGVQRTADS